MILYFSATGNSRYVAERLAASIGDNRLIDMRTLSGGNSRFILSEHESLGFVFPVHSWGMPKGLPELAASLRFDGYAPDSNYCYMACTCGDDCGLTFRQWKRSIKKAGVQGDVGYSVFMPNTYVLLPGFDTDKPETATAKLHAAPQKIAEIAKMIQRNECGDHTFHGHFSRLKSKIIYPAFMRTMTDRPFRADTEKCISCGKCAKVCPTGNIVMDGGRPRWQGNCINCLACYHYCPTRSILYGTATRHKGQYHFPQTVIKTSP